MLDVVIIGCGIIGAATAYELSKYDLSTVVLEKENDVCTGTSKANSAILHAGYDPEPNTLMAKLNIEGVKMAKELCAQLDVPYRQCGSLVLALEEKEAETLKKLYQRGLKNGVEGMRLLNQAATLQKEPNLDSKVVGSLWAPSAAIVCPWEFTLALMETAVKNKVELHLNSEVNKIEKIREGWRITCGSSQYETRYIINAAGVHADEIHNMANPASFKSLPVRGEYFLLDKSEGDFVSSIIFQCPSDRGKGTLIAPTVHGNLIVGPCSQEVGDGDDVATSADGLDYVATMAKRSAPQLNLRQSIRNFAGVRATTDQSDFIIQAVPQAESFIDLAGIKSPGLSAALAIAKMAYNLLEKSGLSTKPKDHFLNQRKRIRFKHCSEIEKTKIISQDSSYGHVICRCEMITEGEIREAFRSPIPPCSIDGLKRRVSAGMGRCQGGFCSPRVWEILWQELKIAPNTVLQEKAGTFLVAEQTKGGTHHG